MRRMLTFAILSCLAAGGLLADFSYEQTTRMTGGTLFNVLKAAGPLARQAREPIVSTVLIRGHKMAQSRKDTAEIIDLDSETITNINFAKKTYSTMTFEEMKQAIQDAMQRFQSKSNDADVKFHVSTQDTGQTRAIGGVSAKELIVNLTMEGTDKQSGSQGAMKITSDMWIAPPAPGYEEVRNFHKLMAAKLGFAPGQGFNPALPNGAQMAKGMAELWKEASKLNGIPVEQVTKIEGQGGESGAGGNARDPNAGGRASSADGGSPAPGGRIGGLAGLAGGLGGFGRRKKPQPEESSNAGSPPNANAGGAGGGGGAVLMEMTTDLTGFSSAPVDASKFTVPAGFQQVEPDRLKRGRR